MGRKIFITTTLPYANSTPHIGHMFEFILADAITRYLKLNGNEVFFNTGLDCHGTKIKQKADEGKIDPLVFIGGLQKAWKDFCLLYNISYDNFYLTSNQDHYEKMKIIWNNFYSRGDIYKKKYKGLYCIGCESFKHAKELSEGKCPDHPTLDLEEIEEENYFFKLDSYKKIISKYVEENSNFINPSTKTKELLNIIEESEDISISRLKSKCPWGIEVPNDPEQIIYVWMEALFNYPIAAGYLTENNIWTKETEIIQICGPDNLRFQGLIFQTLLKAEGLKLTDKLLVHGTIVDVTGKKMSKTEGNIINPMIQHHRYGLDAVRYYTLAGLSTAKDSSWSEEELKTKFNSDICNSWGNFVSRVLHLMDTMDQKEIYSPITPFIFSTINTYENDINQLWNNFEIREALAKTAELVNIGNKYINENAPWKESDPEQVRRILSDCYYLIKSIAKLYSPVFPNKTKIIEEALINKKKVILFNKIL